MDASPVDRQEYLGRRRGEEKTERMPLSWLGSDSRGMLQGVEPRRSRGNTYVDPQAQGKADPILLSPDSQRSITPRSTASTTSVSRIQKPTSYTLLQEETVSLKSPSLSLPPSALRPAG
jgi:hypothetical protein